MLTTPSRRGLELLVISALTVLFTALMLQYSLQSYRLRIEPFYDDIGYFTDAYQRLGILDDKGLAGVFRSIVASPPHSPWSTMLGLAAFATLGVSNIAPYAANGILILVLLLVLFRLRPDAVLSSKVLVGLFVLSAPMAALAVMDFRPDFAANLFLASGTALLFFTANGEVCLSRRTRLAIILLFSGSLLAKPTTVLATVFLICFALGLHVVLAPRERALFRARTNDALIILPSVALLAGWYYVLSFHELYQYISANLSGSIYRDLNKIASVGDRLAFFLTGVGGIQVGRHYAYILGLVALSVGLAVVQRSPVVLRSHLKAFLWIGVAYLGTSLVGIANQSIGLNFQIMLLLTGAHAFHHLLAAAQPTRLKIVSNGAAVVLVVTAMVTGFPPHHGRYSPGEAADIIQINDRLVQRLAALSAGKPAQIATFLTIGLNANPDTFHWLMLRNHLEVTTRADLIPPNLKGMLEIIDTSDIVITSDMNVPALLTSTGTAAVYPYVAFLPAALDHLNTSGLFLLDAKIPTAAGGFYYVFQRKTVSP